jgi:hypothetical protein
MDYLYLDNKPWSYIRFGIGILSLIAALSFLLADFGNLRRLDYFIIFGFSLTGLIHMTNDFGMQKTYLGYDANSLVIKWINKIRPQKINFTEIECIYLRKTDIIISQKTCKPIQLKLLVFRTDQKRELYDFFINLSKTYELNLSRQFTL